MELSTQCSPCDIIKTIIPTQDVPLTLCPCDVLVEVKPVIIKKTITDYCLLNFLTEVVYMKNCSRPQRGC